MIDQISNYQRRQGLDAKDFAMDAAVLLEETADLRLLDYHVISATSLRYRNGRMSFAGTRAKLLDPRKMALAVVAADMVPPRGEQILVEYPVHSRRIGMGVLQFEMPFDDGLFLLRQYLAHQEMHPGILMPHLRHWVDNYPMLDALAYHFT